jgi:uncharacterized cupredoxin-like copper-binding protein
MQTRTRKIRSMRSLVLGVVLIGIMGFVLAACGAEATPTPTTAPPTAEPTAAATATTLSSSGGTAQEVKVTLKEWAIDPSAVEVPAGKVRFVVTNSGQFSHDLAILDDTGEVAKLAAFSPSESPKTLDVDLKAGTYTMICDVTGHAEKGMMGTLTVK